MKFTKVQEYLQNNHTRWQNTNLVNIQVDIGVYVGMGFKMFK